MAEIEMVPLDSSNLSSAGYDPDERVLRIEFQSGGVYDYAGVPEGVYHSLINSPSPGSFFYRAIRNVYPGERVA